VDFAVGSAHVSDVTPEESFFRRINLAEDSIGADDIVDDEPPVYRSLASSMNSNMDEDEDAMATWLAQTPPRPPLLRRQPAFTDVYSQQCAQSWAQIRP